MFAGIRLFTASWVAIMATLLVGHLTWKPLVDAAPLPEAEKNTADRFMHRTQATFKVPDNIEITVPVQDTTRFTALLVQDVEQHGG